VKQLAFTALCPGFIQHDLPSSDISPSSSSHSADASVPLVDIIFDMTLSLHSLILYSRRSLPESRVFMFSILSDISSEISMLLQISMLPADGLLRATSVMQSAIRFSSSETDHFPKYIFLQTFGSFLTIASQRILLGS